MDEIARRRVERLSPEARVLFEEAMRQGEDAGFGVPPDELVVDLHRRMAELPPQDQAEFLDLFGAIAHQAHEESRQQRAEAAQAGGFVRLIERAQELDRRAGRPVKEDMTLGEALARLEDLDE